MPWALEWRPRSLSAQLFLAYLGAWLLAIAVVAAGITWMRSSNPGHWSDHSAVEAARHLASKVGVGDDGRTIAVDLPPSIAWVAQAAPLDFGYRVFDERRQILLWSSPRARQAWTDAGLLPRPTASPTRANAGGLELQMHTEPAGPGGSGLWIEVGLSQRLVQMIHEGSAVRLGGTVMTMIVLSVLLLGCVQFLVLRRLMRPVHRLATQAAHVNFDRPLCQLGTQDLPLELRPLVQSFNEALIRLEQAHARQVRFLADAAHELKTPLALLRCQLELGDARPAELLADVDHLARQVQQMLTLAEVTETRNYRHGLIDVCAVVDDTCARLRPMADYHGAALRVHQHAIPVEVTGDSSALLVLLKNLVENAIAFAPQGSDVHIELRANGICVRDEGPGIDPADLPHIFERYKRAASRRDSGAGLGLAICREVALTHGWHVTASNAEPGAKVCVYFFPQPTT
jgi:two-component system, OmpR family, sensor histidine kinase QseC